MAAIMQGFGTESCARVELRTRGGSGAAQPARAVRVIRDGRQARSDGGKASRVAAGLKKCQFVYGIRRRRPYTVRGQKSNSLLITD